MKRIITAIITVYVLIYFFSSCKKEKPYVPFEIPCSLTRDSGLAKIYINGTWEWVQEKRVNRRQQGFTYLTPKTEGYTLKMIISDSTIKFFKNNVLTESKYKIQLERDITNYFEDSLTVSVSYRISDGVREGYVPIKICNNYLLQQFQYVSSVTGEYIWKKF